jgi:hypothetical protein
MTLKKHFKKKGIGSEGKIHKDFAMTIKQYQGYKQLKADWWSYDASGEKRNAITGALLKAKGLNSGKPDYEFIQVKTSPNNKGLCLAHYIYIEFKKPKDINSPAGTQSDNQRKFESIFKNATNVNYYICYSVKEAIDILINHEFIEV